VRRKANESGVRTVRPTRPSPAYIAAALLSPAVANPLRGAVPPEEIDRALAEVRREPMQWTLPVRQEVRLPDPIGFPLLEILGIALAVAAVVLIAFLITGYLRDRSGLSVNDEPDASLPDPDGAEVEFTDRPLSAARAAAEQGRFDEAIHLLLLGTIEEIRAALEFDTPPWLTSRQIVRRAPLPDAARAALASLVGEVEKSYFGGRPVGEEEYRICVAWHDELRRVAPRKRTR